MMLSFIGTLEWDIKSLEKAMEVKKTNKGVQVKREIEPKLSSSPTQASRAVCTKMDSHDAYRLNFRRSTYALKDKKITYPMV
jgi:hypothetical protein